MLCLMMSLGWIKIPSAACHSLPVLPVGKPQTSIWPEIGRPKDRPDIPRNFLVSMWRSWTLESRRQLSSLQITSQWSPVSPSPESSPYAEISWFPLSGLEKMCEWRFLWVAMCCNLTKSPHFISAPRWHTFPVGPLMIQCELTSSEVSTPVTDCWPLPVPYFTSCECNRLL